MKTERAISINYFPSFSISYYVLYCVFCPICLFFRGLDAPFLLTIKYYEGLIKTQKKKGEKIQTKQNHLTDHSNLTVISRVSHF